MQFAAVMLAACAAGFVPQVARGHEATQASVAPHVPDPQGAAAAEAYQAWLTGTAVELAQQGGARRLALAALLVTLAGIDVGEGAPEPEAIVWMERASLTAGDDPVAASMLAGLRSIHDPAPLAEARRAAAARWHASEPDNLAPLLHLDLEPAELFAAAAAAERFDLHYLEIIRWTAGVLVEHPPGAAMQAAFDAASYAAGNEAPMQYGEQAPLLAAAMVAAFTIPNLQQLMRGCDLDQIEDGTSRRSQCAHIGAILRRASDTEIGAGMGRGLLRRLAAPDALRELDLEDRQRAWTALQLSIATSGEGAGNLPAFYSDPTITSEQGLAERAILEAGLPLEPPAGWDPKGAF